MDVNLIVLQSFFSNQLNATYHYLEYNTAFMAVHSSTALTVLTSSRQGRKWSIKTASLSSPNSEKNIEQVTNCMFSHVVYTNM